MELGQTISKIWDGIKVRRKSWPEGEYWEKSKATGPLCIVDNKGNPIDDWEVMEDTEPAKRYCPICKKPAKFIETKNQVAKYFCEEHGRFGVYITVPVLFG